MPGWRFHVARSVSSREKALEVHKSLDRDPLGLFSHQEWRKVTHKLPVALMIGYSANGLKGARDALRHIVDDEIYNALFRKHAFSEGAMNAHGYGEEQ